MTEYFQDRAGKWRFRIVGTNNEKIVTSQAYASRGNAERGVEDLRAALEAKS